MSKVNKSKSEEEKYSYLYKPDNEIRNMITDIRSKAVPNVILSKKEAIDLAIKTYHKEMILCSNKDTK